MPEEIDSSILIQPPGGHTVEPGIHIFDDCVFAVSQSPRLIVMARTDNGAEISAASTAIEIFLDDMQTNLIPSSGHNAQMNDRDLAKNCMQESFDNINEYLNRQSGANQVSASEQLVAITAVQIGSDYFNYLVMGGFGCYLLKAGKLLNLGYKAGGKSIMLGENPEFTSLVQIQEVSENDLILLGRNSEIESIGLDFLRMTLSRFPEELDMAMRQINTRALRSGLTRAPGLVLTRVKSISDASKGWFGKSKR